MPCFGGLDRTRSPVISSETRWRSCAARRVAGTSVVPWPSHAHVLAFQEEDAAEGQASNFKAPKAKAKAKAKTKATAKSPNVKSSVALPRPKGTRWMSVVVGLGFRV